MVAALPPAPPVATIVHASGSRSVSVGTSTRHLHGRLWAKRIGGRGVAFGSATVSCRTAATNVGAGSFEKQFDVRLAPGKRLLLWQSAEGKTCEATVSLYGKGRLVVELRGY